MAIVSVNLVDTFDEWRVKTNTLGSESGDLAGLATTATGSLVSAINEINTNADLSLKNIVEDVTPELGGDLDLKGNNIINSIGTSNITANGTITTTGDISTNGIVTGSKFIGVVEVGADVTPELGGDLNLSTFDGATLLSTYDIVGTGNINITGSVTATTMSGAWSGNLSGDMGLNSNNITGTGNINITGDVTATGAVSGATLSGAWSGNLSGDLGLNSNNITGTGNINITGSVTATSIAGTVVGVTQSASDNSTKLATTAYVDAQVSTENTLVEMNDTTISGTPSDGQTLTYDAGTQKWVNSTPAASGGGGISLALAIAVG